MTKTKLAPVRDIPMYAVIIRALHERGRSQAEAIGELERRGNWLTPEMQRQASVKRVENLQLGEFVDLEADAYADPNGNGSLTEDGDYHGFEFEYEVVEHVEKETDTCTRVDFESGYSCGFPPWHLVAVSE